MAICLTVVDNKNLNNWLINKVDQALIHTAEYGKILIIHGSTDYHENLLTLSEDRVKHILKDKDVKILTCHSLLYPKWVQERCLILSKDPITISWYGGSTYSAH